MELHELKKLVRAGETDQTEFKRKVRHPEKIVKEMVAFANTKGGHLFVGVNDDLTIPGLKYAEEEDFLLRQSIRDLVRPALDYDTTIIRLSDSRGIVHYRIRESRHKPHYAVVRKNQRWGKAYIRVADKTLQASREVCRILKANKNDEHRAFAYGDHEKTLLRYLGGHDHITLEEYCMLADIPRHEASRILVDLTINHVLKVIPREKEDWFVQDEVSPP